MKNLTDFNSKIEFILTDIDDTLTTEGQLTAPAYEALWQLSAAGFKIIPITGRPAGWCEMIARFWPVDGVIGENGGFYFRYAANIGETQKKMQRWFFTDDREIKKNRQKLQKIEQEVLQQVKGCAIASDQFCRLMDLAVDFCEDVPPLHKSEIEKIVHIFEKHGAQAKVSSIHVNGWYGDYNKLTTTFSYLQNVFQLNEQDILSKCVFIGDSPNDEPMFSKFPHSFGVANIKQYIDQIKSPPTYISKSNGGAGFSEIAKHLISTL